MSGNFIDKAFFVKKLKKGYLPWLILAISMSFTVWLWHATRTDVINGARVNFEFRVEELRQRIINRMKGYEQVLRGGIGLFNATQEVSSEEWRAYVKNIRIDKSYPGIQGIGFSKVISPSQKAAHIKKTRSEGLRNYSIWPEGVRSVYTSIIYLEPLDWRNRRAVGYDMYSEPVRKKAMDMAADENMAAISGKVKLVQETNEDVQAGFLMYLPVYRKGMPVSTVPERRKALAGYVYSPFRMKDLMHGIIAREIPDLNVEIFDGDTAREDSLMYDSDAVDHFKESTDSVFEKIVKIELNGRTWTIHFSTLPVFEETIDTEKPIIVLATGTVISILFFVIAFFQASHRASLRAINEDLNNEIKERAKAEEELRHAHEGLEARVRERTEDLTLANNALQNEIAVRRRTETALRESKERFRGLVETTNDLIWETDATDAYTYVSPAVSAMLGYASDEVIGRPIFDFMEMEEAERLRAVMTKAMKSEKPFIIEKRSVRKDGTSVVIETCGAPITGHDGNFKGYRGIDRDVTERRLMEKEKEQMHAQLLQTQKMELMGRLAAGVAHDFNNIMNIITTLNALAMQESDTGVVRGYLDQISAASERAVNLTRQLLIFSRNQPTKPAMLDINRVIEEMLTLLKHIIGADIQIRSSLAPDLKPVLADKSNIEQLVMNLIVNSKEAISANGEIEIITGNVSIGDDGSGIFPELSKGKYAVITVKDNGNGMEPDTVKRIFEPFFTTKESGKGIGLGLTVVHNVVKEYKGGISVDSRPGEGTVFKICLPAADADVLNPAAQAQSDSFRGKGENILIVEDELILCKSVSIVLARSGYKVFSACSADEAVEIFEREKDGLHLVFSDVVLKGRSGVNVVDDFLKAKPGLKVVFASGYMDIDTQWPYVKEKKFRFLQKPYEVAELLRAIRESLDTHGERYAHG